MKQFFSPCVDQVLELLYLPTCITSHTYVCLWYILLELSK